MTFMQHRITVNATSSRCIDIDTTLQQHHVPFRKTDLRLLFVAVYEGIFLFIVFVRVKDAVEV